ncbi:MAG: hypothetical protein HUJ26_03080 [Planctomycetaceae bacterium]|nr:hypothetical protein [Planctomycetaceae bacterium]
MRQEADPSEQRTLDHRRNLREPLFAFDATRLVERQSESFVDVPMGFPLTFDAEGVQGQSLQRINFVPNLDSHPVTGVSFDSPNDDLWVTTRQGVYVARSSTSFRRFHPMDVDEAFQFTDDPLWDVYNRKFAFVRGLQVNIQGVGFLNLPPDDQNSVTAMDFDNRTGDLWVTTDQALYVARAGDNYQSLTTSHSFQLPPGTPSRQWDIDNELLAYISEGRVTIEGIGSLDLPTAEPTPAIGLDFDSHSGDLWVMTKSGLFLASAKEGYRELTNKHPLDWFPGTEDPDWDVDGNEGVGGGGSNLNALLANQSPSSQPRVGNLLNPSGGNSFSNLGNAFTTASSYGGGGGGSFGGGSYGGGGSFGGSGQTPSGAGGGTNNPPPTNPPGGGEPGDGEPTPTEDIVTPEPASLLLWISAALGGVYLERVRRKRCINGIVSV